MGQFARFSFLLLALACLSVLAKQAINEAASPKDHSDPISSKQDLIGSGVQYPSYASAESVSVPKWGQVTSLGLGVWRLLTFTWMATKFTMRPVLYVLHLLHSIARPFTLLIQLIYHLTVGVPLGILTSLSKSLYPAYLFLGSAAIIGLLLGLAMALSSKLFLLLLPSATKTEVLDIPPASSMLHDRRSKKFTGKQRMTPLPAKRSPPSIRTIMSSQPSLQTPTIFEESEASSVEGQDDFETDSDNRLSPTKPPRDYLNHGASKGPRWRLNRGPPDIL